MFNIQLCRDIITTFQILNIVSNAQASFKSRRNPLHFNRIDFIDHLNILIAEDSFEQMYGMSPDIFFHLVQLLRPSLEPKWKNQHDPIDATITVAIGLRYLRAGSILDLKLLYGLSRKSAYRSIHRFLDAVLDHPLLAIRLPANKDEWNCILKGFALVSKLAVFYGCVGAIDGLFQTCTCPSKNEVSGNVLSYMSGHHCSYGLNCQAMCDARLRFLYFAVVAPGSCNDCVSILRCTALMESIRQLPFGYFIVGDAAYICSDRLLTPFVGAQRDNFDYDNYNFYLSQCRIRIEMAFGRMKSKFFILKNVLSCKYKTASKILSACARLHNYIIDMQFDDGKTYDLISKRNSFELYMYNHPNPKTILRRPFNINPNFASQEGSSLMRELMVKRVRNFGLVRPIVQVHQRIDQQN